VRPTSPGSRGTWCAVRDAAPLAEPARGLLSDRAGASFAVNRTKRLIKTPKLYWADTGHALFLWGDPEPAGAHLENLVLVDLVAWRETRRDRAEILYWRTTNGEEVDLVVELGDRLLPIEVKTSGRPRVPDAAHLRTFREEYGARAMPGVLVHAGNEIAWLPPGIPAAVVVV
jgi:predicted AAA+ superfamily ATPase